MLNCFYKSVSNIFRNQSGNVAMTMAILFPVLFGVVATAVDYSRLSRAHFGLTQAADAAVLAGVKVAAEAQEKGDRDWKQQGKDLASEVFLANVAGREFSDAAFKVDFKISDGVITGTGKYKKKLEMPFAKIMGFPKTEVSDMVATSIGNGNFVDIAFLLDNSMSMGIAATPEDQKKLYNATYNTDYNVGCAFACHTPKNDFEKPLSVKNAHDLGVKLRIDVVAESVAKAVAKLKHKSGTGRVRVSVYTFSNSLEQFIAPTTNLDDVESKLKDLDLVKYRSSGPANIGGTYIRTALRDLRKRMNDTGMAGDGSSASERQSFVVFMSDGVEDAGSTKPSGYFSDGSMMFALDSTKLDGWKTEADALVDGESAIQVFNPDICKDIKNDSRRVFSGQVRYTIATNFDDQWWNIPVVKYITEKDKDIEKAFIDCATDSNHHFVAETSAEIEPMVDDIIDAIMESAIPRLTN